MIRHNTYECTMEVRLRCQLPLTCNDKFPKFISAKTVQSVPPSLIMRDVSADTT